MGEKGTIIYVGAFRFPDRDAAAKRVLANGYVLRNLGYKVIFAGGEQRESDGGQYFHGFEYYSQSELDRGNRSMYQKLKDYKNGGHNTIRWMMDFIKSNKIDYVISYNASFIFQMRIYYFCKKNNIKIIGDCTEWYESEHLPGGKWGLASLDNYLKMKYGFTKIRNLIVISNYLADFYKNKKANLIVIPPLLVTDKIESPLFHKGISNSKAKRIIYAGNPGKKDNLIEIIQVLGRREFLNSIQLTIIGVSREEFLRQNEVEIPMNISFLGRLPYNQVKIQYYNADFSIILRPNKRYANAGFPTKFVESLSFGIPVIATKTSDLDKYLIDGKNGFWAQGNSEGDLLMVLLKVSTLSYNDLAQMKANAYHASLEFDFEHYMLDLGKFINHVK
jgi:glycosyltransferase involved in cell wall biosynthesis